MMNLGNFYKSPEWFKLMQIIKTERLNPQGELICEHCGKPIVRAYDCIGHHVIALTEDNVNDYDISLNPENIMLLHHRCHNKIHNRLGIGVKNVDQRIKLHYGSLYGVRVESQPGKGTICHVMIPRKLYKEDIST